MVTLLNLKWKQRVVQSKLISGSSLTSSINNATWCHSKKTVIQSVFLTLLFAILIIFFPSSHPHPSFLLQSSPMMFLLPSSHSFPSALFPAFLLIHITSYRANILCLFIKFSPWILRWSGAVRHSLIVTLHISVINCKLVFVKLNVYLYLFKKLSLQDYAATCQNELPVIV